MHSGLVAQNKVYRLTRYFFTKISAFRFLNEVLITSKSLQNYLQNI